MNKEFRDFTYEIIYMIYEENDINSLENYFKENKDILNNDEWNLLCQMKKLSNNFINEFYNKFDINNLIKNQEVEEYLIRNNLPKINLNILIKNQKIPNDILLNIINKGNLDYIDEISKYQNLDKEFIKENYKKLNIFEIYNNKNIDQETKNVVKTIIKDDLLTLLLTKSNKSDLNYIKKSIVILNEENIKECLDAFNDIKTDTIETKNEIEKMLMKSILEISGISYLNNFDEISKNKINKTSIIKLKEIVKNNKNNKIIINILKLIKNSNNKEQINTIDKLININTEKYNEEIKKSPKQKKEYEYTHGI